MCSGVMMYVFRGDDDYEDMSTLYVERRESSNSSTVLMSTDYFLHDTVVIRNVIDFQLEGAYLFASKKIVSHSSYVHEC